MSVLILKNYFFIDGLGLVPKIKSVSRENRAKRWIISPTNDNGHTHVHFSDRVYGSAAASYKEAIKTARKISEVLKPFTRTVVKERSDKQVPLDCPGVTLRSKRSSRRTVFFFVVSNPINYDTDYIKIGDELNVMDNWDRALREAKGVRSYLSHKKRKKAKLEKEDHDLVMSL